MRLLIWFIFSLFASATLQHQHSDTGSVTSDPPTTNNDSELVEKTAELQQECARLILRIRQNNERIQLSREQNRDLAYQYQLQQNHRGIPASNREYPRGVVRRRGPVRKSPSMPPSLMTAASHFKDALEGHEKGELDDDVIALSTEAFFVQAYRYCRHLRD